MTANPTPLTPEEIKAPNGPWECFQCGVVCETEDEALDHFGRDSSVPPMCIRAGAYPDGIMGVVRHLQDEVDRWRTEAWGDGRLSASLLYEQVTRADLKTYFGVETAHQAYLRANDDAFAKHVKDTEINRLELDREKAIAERDALRAENAALREALGEVLNARDAVIEAEVYHTNDDHLTNKAALRMSGAVTDARALLQERTDHD